MYSNKEWKMGVTYLTTSSRGKLHVLLNLDLVIDRHGLECARSRGSEVDEEGMPLTGPAKCVVTCAGRLTSIVDKGLVVLSKAMSAIAIGRPSNLGWPDISKYGY